MGLHSSDYDRSNTRAGGDNVVGETMGYFAWKGANTGASDDTESELWSGFSPINQKIIGMRHWLYFLYFQFW